MSKKLKKVLGSAIACLMICSIITVTKPYSTVLGVDPSPIKISALSKLLCEDPPWLGNTYLKKLICEDPPWLGNPMSSKANL